MWRETTKHERNRVIFERELDDFLPGKILDFHVHVYNEGVVGPGQSFSCGGHELPVYTLEDLYQDQSELYPAREVASVCFGIPLPGYDNKRNNAYLEENCDGKRSFALRLFDPVEDTPKGLREDLLQGRYYGIKPYPDFVRKPSVHDAEIHEMLPAWAMEIVNELGMLVMLHIPRKARLADPLNQRQIPELCSRYPKAKIILAHIGRAYYLSNVEGPLDPLVDVPNLYVDLAMLNHWEVLEYTFSHFPQDRILFGSDIPIALAPGKSVEINDQYTYVTPVPWALSISDDHRKLVFTSFLYEELRAIKKAMKRLGLGVAFADKLFYKNGLTLLQGALERNSQS